MPDRPYVFYELTNSLCGICHRKVEAKVAIEGDNVYLRKWCPEHRFQKVLISTDAEYYKLCRQTLKPGQMPLRFNTPIAHGCPFDCGLCPDHEQHSCLALIEITDQCNLTCPICYSDSSPHRPTHRSLEQIEFMLDALVRNEGKPDVVQISGGEPTIHPRFFDVLDLAKTKPIKHLMLNTNGVKIARDPEFARRLAGYLPNFELYLQFDSLRPGPLLALRGQDLTDVRRKAIERLNELNLSTTLVVTLKKGLNDDEIGEILDFAVKQRWRARRHLPASAVRGTRGGFRSSDRSAHARRSPTANSQAVEPLPPAGHCSGPLPPGLPGDGICAEAGRTGHPAHRRGPRGFPAARRGKHNHV